MNDPSQAADPASNTILVPLDGSVHSDQALGLIRSLVVNRRRHVHLLRVLTPFGATAAEREERDEADAHLSLRAGAARRHLRELRDRLGDTDADVTIEVMLGEPVDAIHATATHLHASLIAMVTHGRVGLLRWAEGSCVEEVLRKANAPLLVHNPERAGARPPTIPTFGRMLVALDGSDRSAAVLPHVIQLAKQFVADVTLLTCVSPLVHGLAPSGLAAPYAMPYLLRAPRDDEPQARERLASLAATLDQEGIATEIRVERGDPRERILAVAEACDADLIALTTHGYTGLDRVLLGSTSEELLRRSARPLLVLRAPDLLPDRTSEPTTARASAPIPAEPEILYRA